MSNPNNCSACEYKKIQEEGHLAGHCYMFREEPKEICLKHSFETQGGGGFGDLPKVEKINK
jgi:hypothetical protein